MGITRTDIHTDADLAIAAWARIFSNPARVAILRYLLESERCITGSLTDTIGLAQPTISLHLKEMKMAGLIQGRVSGSSVNYCINLEQWEACRRVMTGFLNQTLPSDCCCK